MPLFSRLKPRSRPGLLAAMLGLRTALAAAAPAGGDYLMAAWETGDGLPENSATAVVQTPDGHLWVGTFNGLARFDGARFTALNPANTPGLPSGGIVNLHLDRAGRLWVSTYAGLVAGEAALWPQFQPVPGWGGDFVRSFTERADGRLLVTSFNGRLFESAGPALVELPAPPGEAGEGYFGGVDEDGHWWAVQHQFIGRREQDRWVGMVSPPDLPADAFGCAPARGGGLWLLMGQELLRLRRGGETARLSLPERPGAVWSLAEDSRGHVWIASYDRGFCEVSPAGLMTRWDAARGVSDQGRSVFEDREGSLWLGTSGDGLLRFTTRRFRHFELVEGRKGLPVNSVSAGPAGDVWAATYGRGLFQLDAAGGIRAGPPLDTPYLQSVLADRGGRLWAGTLGQGLRRADPQGGEPAFAPLAPDGNPIALFEDSLGRLWISSGNAVVWCRQGTNLLSFGPLGDDPADAIRAFAEDAAGGVWAANQGGVFRRDGGAGFVEIKDAAGRPVRHVNCLLGDAAGALWLGTADRGLLRWHDGTLATLDARAGFPVTTVQSLIADGRGFLWLTSGRHLVRARWSSLDLAADGRGGRVECQMFDASDGLPSAEFTAGRQPAATRDARGRLWFATTKGVAMADPANLRLNDLPPPVHVEAIAYVRPDPERGGEIQVRRRGPFTGPETLPAGSGRLEIEYAGLSFVAPGRVQFQVKLEGRDQDWRDVGSRRSAYFHELPPGRHVFRVRAANNDGVWNETGASLALTLLPHFWQTPWFWSGAASLLVGAGALSVWWGTRARVRRAEERARAAGEIRDLAGRLIHAQEDERRRLARELHDDFSQRLALLSVEMELQGAATGRESAAALAGMASRVKELSTEVHRMAYDLHPAKLDQLGLVAAARSCCRELAQQSGLKVAFEPGDLPPSLPADVALCFYRLIQEALQNTVRHAGAREARVELGAAPGRVRLTVSDDGRGFDVERARRAGRLGLSSMQERVRLVRGELKIESAPGRGSRIEASAPLAGTKPK